MLVDNWYIIFAIDKLLLWREDHQGPPPKISSPCLLDQAKFCILFIRYKAHKSKETFLLWFDSKATKYQTIWSQIRFMFCLIGYTFSGQPSCIFWYQICPSFIDQERWTWTYVFVYLRNYNLWSFSFVLAFQVLWI